MKLNIYHIQVYTDSLTVAQAKVSTIVLKYLSSSPLPDDENTIWSREYNKVISAFLSLLPRLKIWTKFWIVCFYLYFPNQHKSQFGQNISYNLVAFIWLTGFEMIWNYSFSVSAIAVLIFYLLNYTCTYESTITCTKVTTLQFFTYYFHDWVLQSAILCTIKRQTMLFFGDSETQFVCPIRPSISCVPCFEPWCSVSPGRRHWNMKQENKTTVFHKFVQFCKFRL